MKYQVCGSISGPKEISDVDLTVKKPDPNPTQIRPPTKTGNDLIIHHYFFLFRYLVIKIVQTLEKFEIILLY